MWPIKKVIYGIVGAFLLLLTFILTPKLYEDVDAGYVLVVQAPIDGTLTVYTTPGFKWQGGGKATHYKKSNQLWFLYPKKASEDPDHSMPVKWNDGAHANISGSIRYDLPLSDAQIIRIHTTFSSQSNLEAQLIKTNMEKAIWQTGPLMSSKESYAEKRNDLIAYIEDQASKGVYKTINVDVKEPDPLSGEMKTVTKVQIVQIGPGNPARQETGEISKMGVRLYNLAINDMIYSDAVEKQIQIQQQSIMSIQTSMANAKKAEQDAITIEKKGQADAAQAKWDQEIIKATQVTQAEMRNRVATLDVSTAALFKQKKTLEGEGEAAYKRNIMTADGALEKKLEAWVKEREFAWDAFSKYQGNLVPLYQTGSSGTGSVNSMNWMEVMGMKAMRDLNLDMSNVAGARTK